MTTETRTLPEVKAQILHYYGGGPKLEALLDEIYALGRASPEEGRATEPAACSHRPARIGTCPVCWLDGDPVPPAPPTEDEGARDRCKCGRWMLGGGCDEVIDQNKQRHTAEYCRLLPMRAPASSKEGGRHE